MNLFVAPTAFFPRSSREARPRAQTLWCTGDEDGVHSAEQLLSAMDRLYADLERAMVYQKRSDVIDDGECCVVEHGHGLLTELVLCVHNQRVKPND
jgi:hypothetical protein